MQTLLNIQALYGSLPKPIKFGNPDHCSECAEHNETLITNSPESISLNELGNPGWDPICYLLEIDEFRYYLPALARLSCGTGDDYYLSQFLFHLNDDRIGAFTDLERLRVADFLEELLTTIPDEIEGNLDTDDILDCISVLRTSSAERLQGDGTNIE